jgi:hypothetical protein
MMSVAGVISVSALAGSNFAQQDAVEISRASQILRAQPVENADVLDTVTLSGQTAGQQLASDYANFNRSLRQGELATAIAAYQTVQPEGVQIQTQALAPIESQISLSPALISEGEQPPSEESSAPEETTQASSQSIDIQG